MARSLNNLQYPMTPQGAGQQRRRWQVIGRTLRGTRGAVGALVMLAAMFGGCTVDNKGAQDNTDCEGCVQPGPVKPDDPTPGETPGSKPANTYNAFCGKACDPDSTKTAATCGGIVEDGEQTGNGVTPADEDTLFSCRIVRDEDGDQASGCGVAGTVGANQPCASPDECLPGFACIRDASGESGTCKKLCCQGSSACSGGANPLFCNNRVIFGTAASAAGNLFAPVCVPASNCQLLTPGACSNGEVCGLVAPGTTHCVAAGTGEEAQACPCKEGYLCSQATKSCRKLCHLGKDTECASGRCVGGAPTYPDGIGVCEANFSDSAKKPTGP